MNNIVILIGCGWGDRHSSIGGVVTQLLPTVSKGRRRHSLISLPRAVDRHVVGLRPLARPILFLKLPIFWSKGRKVERICKNQQSESLE